MVPKGWEEKPLIKLLDKIIDYRGQSVPKADNGIPLITARNVRFGYLDFSNQEYVDEGEFENWMSRGIPDVGDILFTTEAPLGMACRFPEKGRYAVAQRTVTLRTSNRLHSDFLLYFLLSEHGQRLIDIRSSGSTAKGIKSAELKKVKLLHPTCINEQQKIAKILSTWDKAISTTERLIENSTQQKKALMQQLLTGKKRLLDESGKRFESEWEEVTLGECINHTGGTALEKHVKDSASHHFISIGNYSVDGRYIDKGQRVEFNDKTKTKLLNKNDLVMVLNDKTKTGDIIGSTILIDADNKYIYNQRSERIVCSEGIDILFFWFLLNSTPVRADVFGRSQGGTQIYVNFGALKSMTLCLPSFKEQQKIATVLTNADKEIELLKQQLADLQQEKKALMQVLLTGKKRVLVDGEVA
ncbi:hypothetical protein CXF56_09020 [Psychrobacter sp. Choline-02u-13]|uniref:restriction endonuclease subunit S n=1 Tax=unclassified Psychrobacter TaxID=196806 RepID=UPI000C7CC710|nr:MULTISPECIES: restriction endonuclease subunit S [unclassified Psychrobacter]PKG65217.1 hypothetical protein CXF56_09020 [Psychrobacter sp. Choline-02u-13]PKH53197.1 hypothetical protein CXF69_08800 [Psychrobacter sp. Choline-02u-9]